MSKNANRRETVQASKPLAVLDSAGQPYTSSNQPLGDFSATPAPRNPDPPGV